MLFDWCEQGPHICIDAYCPVLLLLEQLVYFHQATTVITILFSTVWKGKKAPCGDHNNAFLCISNRTEKTVKYLGSFPKDISEMTSASSVVQGYRNSECQINFSTLI